MMQFILLIFLIVCGTLLTCQPHDSQSQNRELHHTLWTRSERKEERLHLGNQNIKLSPPEQIMNVFAECGWEEAWQREAFSTSQVVTLTKILDFDGLGTMAYLSTMPIISVTAFTICSSVLHQLGGFHSQEFI